MKKILNHKELFELYKQEKWEEAEKIIRTFMLHNNFINEEQNAKEIYSHIVLVYSMLDRQDILKGYMEQFNDMGYSYEYMDMNILEPYNKLSEKEFNSILRSIYKEKNNKPLAYAMQCARYSNEEDYESLENILERIAIEFSISECNIEKIYLQHILVNFLHTLEKNDIYAYQNVTDILNEEYDFELKIVK